MSTANCAQRRSHLRSHLRSLIAIGTLLMLTLSTLAFAQTPTKRPKRRGRSYAVVINSTPTGATIYLDDKVYGVFGTTPWKGRLVAGSYQLMLERAGSVSVTQTVEVARNTKTIDVTLDREIKPSVIGVTALTDPAIVGADVVIDGQPSGKVPANVVVAAGRHQVVVSKAGYIAFEQWVEVAEGAQVQLSPALKAVPAKTGSMLISADVPSAEIHVDGVRRTEPLPFVIDNVVAGPHVVEARASEQAWVQTVVVEPGKRMTVKAELADKIAKAGAATQAVADAQGKLAAEHKEAQRLAAERDAAKSQMEQQKAELEREKTRVAAEAKAAAAKTAAPQGPGGPPQAGPANGGQPAAVAPQVIVAPAGPDLTGRADRLESERLELQRQDAARRNSEDQARNEGALLSREAGRMKTLMGGRILTENKVALEVGGGYPYYVYGQGTVGVAKGHGLDLDVGLWARSMFTATDGGLRVRFGLKEGELFSAVLQGHVGGGGGVGGRNNFTMGVATVGSLVIGERVALSVSLALDAWSDRLCPEIKSNGTGDKDGADVCYDKLNAADTKEATKMLGSNKHARDTGLRLGTGVGIEIAVSSSMNIGVQVDVAPGQPPRASYSGLFNDGLVLRLDPGYSGRAGVTFIF